MPEISFICIIYHRGYDNYNDKLFGKLLIDWISDDNEGLNLEVKLELESCLEKFNNIKKADLHLEKLGILGVTENYFNTDEDKDIFDVFIDKINKKFILFNEEITLENE